MIIKKMQMKARRYMRRCYRGFIENGRCIKWILKLPIRKAMLFDSKQL